MKRGIIIPIIILLTLSITIVSAVENSRDLGVFFNLVINPIIKFLSFLGISENAEPNTAYGSIISEEEPKLKGIGESCQSNENCEVCHYCSEDKTCELIADGEVDPRRCYDEDTFRKRCFNGECSGISCRSPKQCPPVLQEIKEEIFYECDYYENILYKLKHESICMNTLCAVSNKKISEENCKPPTIRCEAGDYKCSDGECDENNPCKNTEICENFKCVKKNCKTDKDCEIYNKVRTQVAINGIIQKQFNRIGGGFKFSIEDKDIVENVKTTENYGCQNLNNKKICVKIETSEEREVCENKGWFNGMGCIDCFTHTDCDIDEVCDYFSCIQEQCSTKEDCPSEDTLRSETKSFCGGENNNQIHKIYYTYDCEGSIEPELSIFNSNAKTGTCIRKKSQKIPDLNCENLGKVCWYGRCVECRDDKDCENKEFCINEDCYCNKHNYCYLKD